jgi:hypothetical protein
MRTRCDRDHVHVRARGGAHVVGRVADVDGGAFAAQRVALGVGVAPTEHRVDRETHLCETPERVRFVLGGDHDRPSAHFVDGRDRLEGTREQMRSRHAVDDVQLAEPIGPAHRHLGFEALTELVVEVRAQQGVEHLVGRDRRTGLL